MKDYTKVSVLVVGAGPAGLACAITLKKQKPDLEVVVVDKAQGPGNHNLSGAALEERALHELLDMAAPDWRESDQAKKVLARRITKDDVMFFMGQKFAVNIHWKIAMARALKLGIGQMYHKGDYQVSVAELTVWLCEIAQNVGVEVLHGFAVEDIVMDPSGDGASGVKLVDQGLEREGDKQVNYQPGETIHADVIVVAEGCDGLIAEKYIEKAGLAREHDQLYSVGVKEIIKVSDEQYAKFTDGRAVHALGYPIFCPPFGPAIFGGGVMYAMGDNKIAVGLIAALDWKYYDFNPQDALVLFKDHAWVKQFIDGGTVVEAGAKMIPEAGYYAIPRDPATGTIGKANVVLVGDSAGFVNMLKIKGLHNAIESGMIAGRAIADNMDATKGIARAYTRMIDDSAIMKEMKSAKHFRQQVGKFGMMVGMPLSIASGIIGGKPKVTVEPDYETMKEKKYPLKPDMKFDKDTFTAMAQTDHREEQPSHLHILDPNVCMAKCQPKFQAPCITFCPAGVYETIHGEVKSANALNCLHCKTCQRKCPFDNIRWTVPEGTGGPRYNNS